MIGIDISNNNGIIDFYKVKKSGIECVYIKATEGATFKDTYLESNYRGAIIQNLKVGFYHFLVGTSAPEEQAKSFFKSIKDKKSHLKPCLDVEKTGFDIMDYTTRFIKEFESLCNLELCIYTGPYFANKNLNNTLAKYPCWIAHYGVSKPMATTIWGNSYVGHQYTEEGSVDGIKGKVDMNNFSELILIDSSVKLGWNKNNIGWRYCIDNEKIIFYIDSWKEIDKDWYSFDSDGYARCNTFIQDKGVWYYLKSDCKMAKKEWINHNNKWYYLKENGEMATGWFKEKSNWYFLNDDGSMKTGWLYIDEEWYYLNSSGKMVVNTIVDGWEIDSKGIANKI